MAKIEVKLIGFRELKGKMKKWMKSFTNLKPAWNKIRDDLYRIERDQFDSSGTRGGRKWKPLNPEYAAYKEKKRPGRPILVYDNDLRSSLVRRGGDNIYRPDKKQMEFGTKVFTGIIHQEGRGRVPQRKVIDITKKDNIRFTKILQQYVASIKKKLFQGIRGKRG